MVDFDDLHEAGADVQADRGSLASEQAHAPPSIEVDGTNSPQI
jgi:hypothetical protein